jgi:hypothetical protein
MIKHISTRGKRSKQSSWILGFFKKQGGSFGTTRIGGCGEASHSGAHHDNVILWNLHIPYYIVFIFFLKGLFSV